MFYPRYENDEVVKAELDLKMKEFRRWLMIFIYQYGYARGRVNGIESPNSLRWDDTPNYSRLYFGWDNGYQRVDLYIGGDELETMRSPNKWNEHRIFTQGRDQQFSPDQLLEFYQAIDTQLLDLGMTQRSAIRRCEADATAVVAGITCACRLSVCQSLHDHWVGGFRPTQTNGRDPNWVCAECFNTLTTPPLEESHKSDAIQSERSKMSKSLRFKVMQRDNFSCRACGRNARTDGVKLHVDHIKPILHGGLTVMQNLQTLCEDCNLGKSAELVSQMDSW